MTTSDSGVLEIWMTALGRLQSFGYHRSQRVPLTHCLCRGDEVRYFATIDYDDLNMPIYENAHARALAIGDMKSLHVWLASVALL
jgi:hypothetical protein